MKKKSLFDEKTHRSKEHEKRGEARETEKKGREEKTGRAKL